MSRPDRCPGSSPRRPNEPHRSRALLRGVMVLAVRVTVRLSSALTGVRNLRLSTPKFARTGPGAGSTNRPAASETTR